MGTACLVLAMVGAGALVARQPADPEPVGPSPSPTPTPTPDAQSAPRKLAWTDDYWWTSSFHYGEQVVDVREQAANLVRKREGGRTFITLDATDTGVGFHMRDGRIWLADGSSVEQIGDLGMTQYDPLAGAVESGSSGSLLAWIHTTSREAADLVVYDTSSREEVVRQAIPECGNLQMNCSVELVGEDNVYWTSGGDPGPFDRHLMRLDVATGVQTEVTTQDLADDLASRPRGLVVGESADSGVVTDGLNFQRFEVRGDRLVPTVPDDPDATVSTHTDTRVFDTATRAELRLRIPDGYDRADEFTIFEWVDDDRIALMADLTHDFLSSPLAMPTSSSAASPAASANLPSKAPRTRAFRGSFRTSLILADAPAQSMRLAHG